MTSHSTHARQSAAMQAVVFLMDSESFAVPITMVREILDHRCASRIPEGPEWLIGLADFRGETLPLVDLRVRLGLAPIATTLATRILVIDMVNPADDRMMTLGLVVDRVLDVASFAAGEVEDTPDIGTRWHGDYLSGVVRRDGGFILFLDITRISLAAAHQPLISDVA